MKNEYIKTKFKSDGKTIEIVKQWTEGDPNWYVSIYVDSILTYEGWAFPQESE